PGPVPRKPGRVQTTQEPGLFTDKKTILYFTSPFPEGETPSKYCSRTSEEICSARGRRSSSLPTRWSFPPLEAASIWSVSTESSWRCLSLKTSKDEFFMPTGYTGTDTRCKSSAIFSDVSSL